MGGHPWLPIAALALMFLGSIGMMIENRAFRREAKFWRELLNEPDSESKAPSWTVSADENGIATLSRTGKRENGRTKRQWVTFAVPEVPDAIRALYRFYLGKA